MYQDSPSDLVWEYVGENIFPNQPIGKRIIGTEESVRSITREDIIETINEHYKPENFLVVSVGNFEITETTKLVDKYLKPKNSESTLQIVPGVYSPQNKYNFIKKSEVNQIHAVISFPGVMNIHPDKKRLDLLSTIIGDGLGSMLFSVLREELGIAYYVGAFCDNNTDCGAFNIYFGCNIEKFKEVVERIFLEISKIKNGDITDKELERAQNLLYSEIVMAHENVGYLARSYGIEKLLTGKFETIDELKEKYYAIDKTQLSETAAKYLNENFSITYIANEEVHFV
jgi:predicted Zn-dependent peptidase